MKKITTGDFPLYAMNGKEGIAGVIGSYVDESTSMGTRELEEESCVTERNVNYSPRMFVEAILTGIEIENRGRVFYGP